jgi:hypothetical protein
MALKPCKECKKEVSTSATACPNCGVKNPTRRGPSKIVLYGGGALLLGMCAVARSGGPKPNGNATSSLSPRAAEVNVVAVPVTALKLWRDYDANEVSADSNYKGRLLAVSGNIDSINKDAFNNVSVMLRSPNEFMPVHATLKDSQTSRAGNLAKGQSVVVTCMGGGMIVGTPILQDCTIR